MQQIAILYPLVRCNTLLPEMLYINDCVLQPQGTTTGYNSYKQIAPFCLGHRAKGKTSILIGGKHV